MQQKDLDILESTIYGTGSGIGFFLAILAIAAIREKIAIQYSSPSRGLGIIYYNRLMAIGFMSFMVLRFKHYGYYSCSC